MTLMRKHFRVGKGLVKFYSSSGKGGHFLTLVYRNHKVKLKIDEADLEVFIDAVKEAGK